MIPTHLHMLQYYFHKTYDIILLQFLYTGFIIIILQNLSLQSDDNDQK